MQIFAVWDKGRDQASDLVRRCFDRWEALNPGHELVVLDREAMLAAMPTLGIDPGSLTIQTQTDILRTHLLATKGGVWTDATVLPVVPLDAWLPQALGGAGFFFFSNAGHGRRVASWFIAAEPGNAFLARLDREVAAYWDRKRTLQRPLYQGRSRAELGRLPETFGWKLRWLMDPNWPVSPRGRRRNWYPYFWFHHLVGWLESSDPGMRRLMAAMPQHPARVPHALQKAQATMPPDAFASALPGLLAAAPLHKLNWRKPPPEAVFALPAAAEAHPPAPGAAARLGDAPENP